MKIFIRTTAVIFALVFISNIFTACTKYGNGFLSPSLQYAVSQFTIIRGRATSSYSLVTDGSSIPMHIKWTHIYDINGNVADSLFTKLYPVGIWTSAYNPLTDTNYNSIIAKRSVANLPPITVNESNGTIEANSGTIYLPVGTYNMQLQVSNSAGVEKFDSIMQIVIQDGKPLETSPEQGNFSNGLLYAGTASSKRGLYNNINNPFDSVVITRFADTPNVLILRITDKNGIPFDPSKGEVAKRPNSGLNPNPPFLQNLQDYAPDTYVATDTSISIKFPLTPFPIASLGNGFNMYYRIPTQYVQIDSTSSWSSNVGGGYYQGVNDSHYLGVLNNDLYDYSIRIPMRIQVPGSYEINIKILNATHR